MRGRRVIGLIGLLCSLAAVSRASPGAAGAGTLDSVIERARAYIGPEDALRAVETLRFVGELEDFQESSAGAVEILLMKPGLIRTTIRWDDRTQIVAADEFEGWTRQEQPGARPRTAPLDVPTYWATRFGGIDNLYFFRGYEPVYGRAEYAGTGFLEGRAVEQVRVYFNADNVFLRQFSTESGRLLASRKEGRDLRILEHGELVADGLRFARTIENYVDGERVSRLTFSAVQVNPEVDPALFRYPHE